MAHAPAANHVAASANANPPAIATMLSPIQAAADSDSIAAYTPTYVDGKDAFGLGSGSESGSGSDSDSSARPRSLSSEGSTSSSGIEDVDDDLFADDHESIPTKTTATAASTTPSAEPTPRQSLDMSRIADSDAPRASQAFESSSDEDGNNSNPSSAEDDLFASGAEGSSEGEDPPEEETALGVQTVVPSPEPGSPQLWHAEMDAESKVDLATVATHPKITKDTMPDALLKAVETHDADLAAAVAAVIADTKEKNDKLRTDLEAARSEISTLTAQKQESKPPGRGTFKLAAAQQQAEQSSAVPASKAPLVSPEKIRPHDTAAPVGVGTDDDSDYLLADTDSDRGSITLDFTDVSRLSPPAARGAKVTTVAREKDQHHTSIKSE